MGIQLKSPLYFSQQVPNKSTVTNGTSHTENVCTYRILPPNGVRNYWTLQNGVADAEFLKYILQDKSRKVRRTVPCWVTLWKGRNKPQHHRDDVKNCKMLCYLGHTRVFHQAMLQHVNMNTVRLKLWSTDAIHQWLTPDFKKLGGHVGRKIFVLVPAFSPYTARFLSS